MTLGWVLGIVTWFSLASKSRLGFVFAAADGGL
jgi:hypothetical protein